MKNAMQEVPADHEFYAQAQQLHLESEKHLQYFTTQGNKKMANEIMQRLRRAGGPSGREVSP